MYGISSRFINDIIGSQNPAPLCQPMSAFALPRPPFVSHGQHFANPLHPPPLAADIICEHIVHVIHIVKGVHSVHIVHI